MALIVEDGTGLTNADSYLSVTECDLYHTKFGNTAWVGTTGEKEIALRKATRYLDMKYGNRWYGDRSTKEQSLDWPRYGVVDRDGYEVDDASLPADLKHATAEAALVCLSDDPLADISTDDSAGANSELIKAGPIEISTSYAGGKSIRKQYSKVDGWLSSITVGPGSVERG